MGAGPLGRRLRGTAFGRAACRDQGLVHRQAPDDFYTAAPEVTIDNDEILVAGPLSAVDLEQGATAEAATTAEEARIERFREDTREHRMRIAEEAQARFGRVVSWGATAGDTTRLFTTANVPVMTRLRMSQRQVLDTLIDAGIARSSERGSRLVRRARRQERGRVDRRAARRLRPRRGGPCSRPGRNPQCRGLSPKGQSFRSPGRCAGANVCQTPGARRADRVGNKAHGLGRLLLRPAHRGLLHGEPGLHLRAPSRWAPRCRPCHSSSAVSCAGVCFSSPDQHAALPARTASWLRSAPCR